ncbi:M16 family metallopeptidase, partial [Aegicerativicinus sediminis]
MLKTYRILLLMLSIVFFNFLEASAQHNSIVSELPENTRVTKGVLSNGMTYYIYPTDVTEGVASYYIIQNVGSVLENDEQKGLAHFLEHMAFNGTENFEGKGILKTLEKQGAIFGRDINAYTSFDETVYNLNNIPTRDGLVDTCLLILRDWSNYLLLTEEEIDAERGVIKEEWRTRQSGGMRILQQNLPAMFNNSIYAERLPIGDMKVVEGFEYDALRDFYHDWYRTDLQAIAVIGDFDVKEIESKIKVMFSDIPAVENPKERTITSIPDNEAMIYNLSMDEEVASSNISFVINHPKNLGSWSKEDFKTELLNNMVQRMVSDRLKEISQKPESPFLSAGLFFRDMTRANRQLTLAIRPKSDMQHEAFKTAMIEMERASKFGFVEAEVERALKDLYTNYETQISKEDDWSHGQIEGMIQKNYLENEPMTDVKKEYELAKSLLEGIQPNAFHERFKALYTSNNRVLLVTGVEGRDNLTEQDAKSIIKEVETNNEIEAYKDSFAGKSLLNEAQINPGKIISEKIDEVTGAKVFELSNGAKVHYSFVDKNKNDVSFYAISDGGTSLLNDDKLPSASMSVSLAQMSGLGEYNAVELPKVLAGKTARTQLNLSDVSESINGSSTTKDVETLLQMVYMRFEKPRFDADAYKVMQGNISNFLQRKTKNLGSKMQDSITVTLYGTKNPRNRLFDEAYAEEITFDEMVAVYKDRFKDASDFDFFIVGDISEEAVKPLIAKYIGGITSSSTDEDWKNKEPNWLDDTIKRRIFLPMEDPKATVRIGFEREQDYTIKADYIANTLSALLKLRYTETLREEEGGTYGAGVR